MTVWKLSIFKNSKVHNWLLARQQIFYITTCESGFVTCIIHFRLNVWIFIGNRFTDHYETFDGCFYCWSYLKIYKNNFWNKGNCTMCTRNEKYKQIEKGYRRDQELYSSQLKIYVKKVPFLIIVSKTLFWCHSTIWKEIIYFQSWAKSFLGSFFTTWQITLLEIDKRCYLKKMTYLIASKRNKKQTI